MSRYQVMPRLSETEYAALEASIGEHGVQVPVVVDEAGAIVDGHHRAEIAERLGIDYPRRVLSGLEEESKRNLAWTLNLDRRHLSRDQRRRLVESSLRADPQLSDRQHAARTGVSATTAGKVRADLLEAGEVSKLDTRTDARGRQQPATRRPATPPAGAADGAPPATDSDQARPLPPADQTPRGEDAPSLAPEAERAAGRDAPIARDPSPRGHHPPHSPARPGLAPRHRPTHGTPDVSPPSAAGPQSQPRELEAARGQESPDLVRALRTLRSALADLTRWWATRPEPSARQRSTLRQAAETLVDLADSIDPRHDPDVVAAAADIATRTGVDDDTARLMARRVRDRNAPDRLTDYVRRIGAADLLARYRPPAPTSSQAKAPDCGHGVTGGRRVIGRGAAASRLCGACEAEDPAIAEAAS